MYLLLRSLVKHQSESKNTDDLIQSVSWCLRSTQSLRIHEWESQCFRSVVMHLWRLYFILPNLFSILVCNPFFFQSIFPGSWIKKAYEEIQKAIEILKNALWKGNGWWNKRKQHKSSRQISETQQALNVTFFLLHANFQTILKYSKSKKKNDNFLVVMIIFIVFGNYG